MTARVSSVDARTGEAVELDAAPADTERVDAVVRAAAGVAPALSAAGIPGRARLLRAISDAITEDEEPITAAADRETALGPVRMHSELARTAYQLRLFAEVLEDGAFLDVTIDHPDPDAIPAPRPDLRRMMLPIGPVGVFSASNFPLAFSVAGGDTASALAAGCPVVVKAHSGHPQTSELTAAAVRRAATAAGLPADVLTVVHGRQAGRDLVCHPLLKAVGFTGSLAGGRALYDLACSRPDPIPFYGELGSVNPLVVTPAAAAERAERIAGGLAGSFTLGLGQFCTKPGLAFIPAGPDGQRLTGALVEAAAQVAPGSMLTPSIREGYASGLAERVKSPGVRAPLPSAPSSTGALAGPQVLSLPVTELTDLFYEECFGPLLVLVEYSTVDELVAALSRVPGTLTATIHCGSEEDGPVSVAARAAGVLRERAGRVVWNGYPTGVAVTWAMQHGGPYPSSTSAAHTSVGTAAIRRFLRPVTYQDTPPGLLPPELREENPLRLPRRVDGAYVLP
jgi:NADP-dependent aldehyde dehydrogenase